MVLLSRGTSGFGFIWFYVASWDSFAVYQGSIRVVLGGENYWEDHGKEVRLQVP